MNIIPQNIFLAGEGKKGEHLFLAHLKSIYDKRYSNIKVYKPIKANGGSPLEVVQYVMRVLKSRYSWSADKGWRVVILVDNDRNEIAKARQFAKQNNFILLENDPDLESTFLLILGEKFDKKQMKKRISKQFLEDNFSQTILEKQRKKVGILNTLISYIETGDPPDTGQ